MERNTEESIQRNEENAVTGKNRHPEETEPPNSSETYDFRNSLEEVLRAHLKRNNTPSSSETETGNVASTEKNGKNMAVPSYKKVTLTDMVAKFLIVFAAIFFLAFFFVRGKDVFKPVISKNIEIALPKLEKSYNFLLLGTDLKVDVNRTDTMMLLHVDCVNKRLVVVSIPRDSKVQLGRHGTQKINGAYAFGLLEGGVQQGLKAAREAVENLIGLKIDYYIKVELAGFEHLIDLIGGVNIYVDKDMHYDDYRGNLHIHLKKGQQHLDGAKALQYVRFRKDRMGDLKRVERQQLLLRSILNRLKEPEVVVRIPAIVEQAFRYIETDLDLKTALALSNRFRDLDSVVMKTYTLPGVFSEVTEEEPIAYYLPNKKEIAALVEKILNPGTEEVKAENPPVKNNPVRKKEEKNQKSHDGQEKI